MGQAHRYATAILHRGRVPMEPVGFEPDWTDRPRKWKHFPGLEPHPLPDRSPVSAGGDGSTRRGLLGPDGGGRFDLGLLGGMLRDSYGLLGRRLGIQANTDLAALPSYPHANWHRGTASGGGLYPVSVTYLAGPSGPLLPGAYHYSPAQHALHRLLTGDLTTQVRDALGDDGVPDGCDQFLVLGVKYWQNAFKYNSFCFHAVSMDVGAAASTLRAWARAAGLSAEPRWWFDETGLSRLLGVEDGEGVFAVVPLRWAAPGGPADRPVRRPATRPDPGVRVSHRERERSRTVLRFADVDAMQAATVQAGPGRPDDGALDAAAVRPLGPDGVAVPLPVDPALLDVPLRTALRRRRSSFGRFDAREPLSRAHLGTVLEAADRAGLDVLASSDPAARLVRLYVFACHVDGVAPGTYGYDPGSRGLRPLTAGHPGRFLQDSYFLANYNLEQAGAVVVPAVRTAAVLDAVGDRGYRLVNAAVGAVAQATYTAAAALGTGCGVALGFDGVSYVEHLGLAEDGEIPLLLMMLGGERPGSADFRYEIA